MLPLMLSSAAIIHAVSASAWDPKSYAKEVRHTIKEKGEFFEGVRDHMFEIAKDGAFERALRDIEAQRDKVRESTSDDRPVLGFQINEYEGPAGEPFIEGPLPLGAGATPAEVLGNPTLRGPGPSMMFLVNVTAVFFVRDATGNLFGPLEFADASGLMRRPFYAPRPNPFESLIWNDITRAVKAKADQLRRDAQAQAEARAKAEAEAKAANRPQHRLRLNGVVEPVVMVQVLLMEVEGAVAAPLRHLVRSLGLHRHAVSRLLKKGRGYLDALEAHGVRGLCLDCASR
jgi:hypothetical protein